MINENLIDREKTKAQDQRKIRLIADLLMIVVTVILIFDIVRYYELHFSDSWYIPSYSIAYVYKMVSHKIMLLAIGLLAAQITRIFGKYTATIVISTVFIVAHFLLPQIFSWMNW